MPEQAVPDNAATIYWVWCNDQRIAISRAAYRSVMGAIANGQGFSIIDNYTGIAYMFGPGQVIFAKGRAVTQKDLKRIEEGYGVWP